MKLLLVLQRALTQPLLAVVRAVQRPGRRRAQDQGYDITSLIFNPSPRGLGVEIRR